MILLTHLNTISDPRRREGRRFDLPHLLLFSLLAIISGANSYRSITRFYACAPGVVQVVDRD
jgi:hypothetical protein